MSEDTIIKLCEALLFIAILLILIATIVGIWGVDIRIVLTLIIIGAFSAITAMFICDFT